MLLAKSLCDKTVLCLIAVTSTDGRCCQSNANPSPVCPRPGLCRGGNREWCLEVSRLHHPAIYPKVGAGYVAGQRTGQEDDGVADLPRRAVPAEN